MPTTPRQAAEALLASPKGARLFQEDPEAFDQLVQDEVRRSYAQSGQGPPGLDGLTDPRVGAGTASGITTALSALPEGLGDALAGVLRTVGNLPRAVAQTMQLPGFNLPPPFGINPFGEHLTPPDPIEESVPDLAMREGAGVTDFLGQGALMAGGAGLASMTRLGPKLGPIISDFILGTAETGSPSGGLAASAGGALPPMALNALRGGGERAGRFFQERGLNRALGTSGVDEARATRELSDQILSQNPKRAEDVVPIIQRGAETARRRLVQREGELTPGGKVDIDPILERLKQTEQHPRDTLAEYTTKTQIKEGAELPSSLPSNLTPEQLQKVASAFNADKGMGGDALAQLASKDPELARALGIAEEVPVRTPRETSPLSQKAGVVEGLRNDLKASARAFAEEEGINAGRAEEAFNRVSDEKLLGLRNALARRSISGSLTEKELETTVQHFRNGLANNLEETLVDASGATGDPLTKLEDDFLRWLVVIKAVERRMAETAGAGGPVTTAMGATAGSFNLLRGDLTQAIMSPIMINTTAEILRSSRWPLFAARYGRGLANALANGNVKAVQRIAGIVGGRIGAPLGVSAAQGWESQGSQAQGQGQGESR